MQYFLTAGVRHSYNDAIVEGVGMLLCIRVALFL